MPPQLATNQVVTQFHAQSGAETRRSQAPTKAALDRMRRYAELTGLPLMYVDVQSGAVIETTDPGLPHFLPEEVRAELPQVTDVRLIELSSGLTFFAIPLPKADGPRAVAVGYVPSRGDFDPREALAYATNGTPQDALQNWLSRQSPCPASYVKRLLGMAVRQVKQEYRELELHGELEQLSDQLELTYEEISLLHSLTRKLHISRSPKELAQVCLRGMQSLIDCEGNVILLEAKNRPPQLLNVGHTPFDEAGLYRLIDRFEDHDWSRPIVKNNVCGTDLGDDFPGLKNLVLVPIAERSHRSGWILSCNQRDGREFGTVEASLLNSIATILGTHLRNIDLYQQHEQLMLSFVQSLVSTIDAKDPYTRGHSERVALIARRLGEELGLPEDELHTIYRSGLLHDVGKIGVNDAILQKPGRLTDEEFKAIQQHPLIGYEILKDLKNLHDVLPGVRSHHESYNGTGYPDGLKGEEIPLMARILAVADSYDAMGSDRPYRKGMPLEKVEDIFRHGSGKQWDSEVIDAYFRIRDEIRRLCEEYENGVHSCKIEAHLQAAMAAPSDDDDADD